MESAFFGFAQQLLDNGQAREKDTYEDAALYDYAIQFDYDIPFYSTVARQSTGPVLDIGCGSGRVLLPLLEAGVEAEGMDLSDTMLAMAKDKLQVYGYPNAPLYQGNMRSFALDRRYGCILIPYQSMMYMLDDEQRREALRRCHHHLQSKGLLAFDFDCSTHEVGDGMPYLALQGQHPFHGHVMLQVVQVRAFADGRRCLNQINYELTDPVKISVQASQEASCSAERMQLLLEETGFVVEGVYGDFAERPYQGEAQCIILARRQE